MPEEEEVKRGKWTFAHLPAVPSRFALKPMTSGEAIDQLELLGHDFFVFHNAEENQINVVYRRKRGDYGLIQPE